LPERAIAEVSAALIDGDLTVLLEMINPCSAIA
jgi:hypothetical protein